MRFIPFRRKNEKKTDAQLIGMYLDTGDIELLGTLFGRYLHLVYGICLKYFRERQGAKDAVMDIYEKLAEELPRHKIRNFKSWLYVLSKNHCLMELRKTPKGKTIYLSGDAELEHFMENGHELHPVDKDDQDGLMHALQECMKKLKNEQQDCIHLFYYKNKCYKEIAVIMKIEEKKVKSHIQNGKRNLKICLENNQ